MLGSYGSGAVMAVPAHDSRDAEFAATHGLPVRVVVAPPDGATAAAGEAFTGDGVAVASACPATGLALDGLDSPAARAATLAWLEAAGTGSRRVNYKLRDWLFARQRYWGEPFPIVYEEGSDEPRAVDAASLPLVLPPVEDFKPTGTPDPPLARVPGWSTYTDPDTGRTMVREASTMPQWAGSCWYYIRYLQARSMRGRRGFGCHGFWVQVLREVQGRPCLLAPAAPAATSR